MKKNILYGITTFLWALLFCVPEIERITINSMSDIKQFITPQTFFVFDIDNTILYEDSSVPTGLIEPDIFPPLFDAIKKYSFGTVAITARNTTDYYEAFTVAELQRFGISFSPIFPHSPTICILTNTTSKAFYTHGIIFAQGTNKGKALHSLLSALPRVPNNIVFVDDMHYNLDDITTEFKNNSDFSTLKKITLCDYPYVYKHIKAKL